MQSHGTAFKESNDYTLSTLPLYPWAVRPALFALDAERAHDLTMSALRRPMVVRALAALPHPQQDPRLSLNLLGLSFDHPVGLAAGLDKHGAAAPAWAALGFAFAEMGTVTPRPQPGNPRPRLFRLQHDHAIINRFGFNSVGGPGVAANLAASLPLPIRVGVNLGKNKTTPNEQAADDYLRALEVLHPYADYVVINVSSPNTAGLRDLQESRALRALVEQVVRRAGELTTRKTIAVLVKFSPDAEAGDLLSSVDAALEGGVKGLVATNTTVGRSGLTSSTHAAEAGGLSGRPLRALANDVCRALYRHVGSTVPIVGVGGIFSAADAYERVRAGASLLQLYTALIYEGPGVVTRIVQGLSRRLAADGFSHLSEVVGIDVR